MFYLSSKLKAKSFKLKAKQGFTLIELLVVLGIFVVLTSVVLTRQNRFSSDTLLTDMTYQVALSVREAQTYGLGVRSGSSAGSDANFDAGFGLHLVTGNTFSLFKDVDKNGLFDIANCGIVNPNCDTKYKDYYLNKGSISKVCGLIGQGKSKTSFCTNSQGLNGINSLDIVYIRPDPQSIIGDPRHRPPLDPVISSYFDYAVITIVSALGDRYKCVKVDSTGQVSVYNPTPPTSSTCS